MSKLTMTQILEKGLEMEVNARAFYQDATKIVEHPGARKMLAELAEEEDEHVKLFSRALAGEDVEFGKDAPTPKQDLKIGEYLANRKVVETSDPGDILVAAIKAEMAAIKVYGEWAKQVDDPKIVAFLEGLVKEETVHKARLERIYDDEFLTDN